jgi:excisionase family DNA binding protein
MTTAELAQQLHLNEETVRKLARARVIPCIRLVRTLRFDLEAVEAAIAKASAAAPARLQPA